MLTNTLHMRLPDVDFVEDVDCGGWPPFSPSEGSSLETRFLPVSISRWSAGASVLEGL